MQKLLLARTTMVLAASISVAKAQNTQETPSQNTQPSERGGMMHGMMGGGMPGRGSGERHMMMAHMMAQTTGAIFHIRRGDTSIVIRCAENESTQACVTAAGTLLDKFNSPTTPPKP